MKQYFKILLVFIFSIALNIHSFSQKADEKIAINESIEYANSLIWHINYNLRALRNFQNELIIWAEDPNRIKIDKPEYNYISFSGEKKVLSQNFDIKNTLFDYDYQLNKIDKQVLAINLLCKRIESLKYSHRNLSDEKRSLKDLAYLINTVKLKTFELAETSYDFSRACAISFKASVHPSELSKVKNVVSQSKNLILAIRNNDKQLTKEYLDLLTKATEVMEKTTNVRELYILSKSSLSLEENHGLIIEIYHKAFNIASWGEMYLQSSFSENETNILLQEAISEFNEAEGKMGCASGLNTILQYSQHDLMFYTEEPNSIIAEDIIPVEKNNSTSVTKVEKENPKLTPTTIKEPITIQETFTQESKEILEQKEIIKEVEKPAIVEKKFDKSDINSLAGSLPNNLIVLLDVSASMKKSGKLPILKKSISHFLNIMREEDKISLITYSGETKVLVSGASKQDKYIILDTLSKVKSSGGSDIYNALKEAYKVGETNFIENGNNKIIIASDGIFGVDYSTLKYVKQKTEEDYTLSVFQYSNENEEINFKSLKNLALIGKGTYKVVYNNNQAINAMMQEIKKQYTKD